MFSDSIVALITPFFQGSVDKKALKNLVEWQILEGTQAIVACGSTGEALLLTPQERHEVLSTVLEAVNNRIPVIAGCGSASTAETLAMVQHAQSLGVAAALVVTPYYVKPMPEGVFQHFQAISQGSTLPIIIYNNPGRSVVDLSVPLIARLATLPTVVGIKDSHPDVSRPIALRQAISKPFCILSGEDGTASAFMANGGDGCISVTANVAPKLCQQMMTAWKTQDLKTFAKTRDQLMPLNTALFTETNPSGFKYAVSLLGKCHNELRLPLVPVSLSTEALVKSAMAETGLLP